jgi:hypothetical protein
MKLIQGAFSSLEDCTESFLVFRIAAIGAAIAIAVSIAELANSITYKSQLV